MTAPHTCPSCGDDGFLFGTRTDVSTIVAAATASLRRTCPAMAEETVARFAEEYRRALTGGET